MELSFLYRGITSKKKKKTRNKKYRPSALEISTINNKACGRQLGNFDVVELGPTGYQRASHLRHYTTALVSQAFALSLALKDFTQTIML